MQLARIASRARFYASNHPPPLKAWPRALPLSHNLQLHVTRSGLTQSQASKQALEDGFGLLRSGIDASQSNRGDSSLQQIVKGWHQIVVNGGAGAIQGDVAVSIVDALARCGPWSPKAASLPSRIDLQTLSRIINRFETPENAQSCFAKLAWVAIASGQSELALTFWRCMTQEKGARPGRLRVSLPLVQATIAATALDPESRPSASLERFATSINITSNDAFSLFSDQRFIPAIATQALHQSTLARIDLSIKQFELAYIWSLDRNAGLVKRVKKWADQHNRSALGKVWAAVCVASGPDGWVVTEWNEEVDVDNTSQIELPRDADDPAESKGQLLFTPDLVAAFIISFMRLNMMEQAGEIWQILQERKLPTTKAIWKAVIAGHVFRRDPDSAAATCAQYVASTADARPDPIMEAFVVRALLKAGRTVEGLERIRAMQQSATVLPTQVVNRLLTALLESGLYEEADSVVNSMPLNGVGRPDATTFNTLIAKWAGANEMHRHRIPATLLLMQRLEVQPDDITCRMIVRSLLKDDRVEAAASFLHSLGRTPSPDVQLLFIEKYLQAEETEEAAWNIWNALAKDEQVANEVTFANMVRILANKSAQQFSTGQEAAGQRSLSQAYEIKRLSESRGLTINSVAQNSLMRAHFSNGSDAHLRKALKIFDGLRKPSANGLNSHPHPSSWAIVLLALDERGDWKQARKLVAELENSDFTVTGSLRGIVKLVKSRA